MGESVSKELLSRATPSETRSLFLPLAPARLSSEDEDKLDADNDETVEGSQNSTREETIEPTDKTEEISDAKREVVRVRKVKTKNNQKNEVDVEVIVPEETSVEEKTDCLKSSPKSESNSNSRRESNVESKKQRHQKLTRLQEQKSTLKVMGRSQ